MSITSMVIGTQLANSANPGMNMWQAAPAPDASTFWGNKVQAPKTVNLPDWQDWSFQRFSQPDFQFSKYGQAAPKYKGLMNGDYNALQEALATPGRIDAKTAYDDTKAKLSSAATNRGRYGSSTYTTQMVDSATKPYLDTLAKVNAQAGASRYGLQQNDLQFGQQNAMQEWLNLLQENNLANQTGLSVWGSRLNENNLMNQLGANQNIAKNGYNLNRAVQQLGIDNAPILFNNSVQQAMYGDLWDRTNYQNAQAQRLLGNVMNWAQLTDEYSDAGRAKQISRASQEDNGMGGLLGGLGSIAGTALSFIPGVGPVLSTAATLGGQAFNQGLSGVSTGSLAGLNTPYL